MLAMLSPSTSMVTPTTLSINCRRDDGRTMDDLAFTSLRSFGSRALLSPKSRNFLIQKYQRFTVNPALGEIRRGRFEGGHFGD
jgi:hypothetical protein